MTEVDRLEYIISADPSQAVQAFKETGTEYDKMDKKLSASSSSQFGTNIASGANTAKGAIGTLSGALDTLTSKLKGISAGQAFAAIESGASKASRTMQGIGIAATAVGVPVGLLAKSSLSAFAELESQIQRDVSLIGGGKAEFQELLDLSKQLGETTPFNTTEIARGVESLAAAGYSMEQIKAAMGTVTEMSIAAGEPLEAMSDILVNVLSQFGGAATDAEHFADVLAVGANESTASITDMGEALKYAGNMAPITQKSVEEFSAALTVMANNGIKGTMAGTGLVDILGDLAKPAAPAQEALKELGLTKEDIDPATNSLEELLTTLNRVGLADPANLNKLYTIFGKQGAPKISSLISDEGLAKYKEIVDKMVNESTNANKRMADAQRDTLDYALQQISESFQKVQLAIGEGLKPLALELNQFLLKNGDTITTFAKNAVEGLTPFVKKILELGKSFMEWFNSLPSDMQSKVASLTGLGAAVAAIGGPLLLLGSLPVAAIGNIAGVLKGLFEIKATSAIGAGVSTLVTSLKDLNGITAVKNISQYLVPIGPAAAGAAGEVGLLTSAIATLGGPIGAGAVVAVAAGIAAYTTNFGDFRDNVNAIISDLGSAASNIASGDFEDAGRDCAEAFSKGLEAAWDVSVATIGSLPEINRAISEMKSGFDKAAFEMSKGFADQLTSTISGLTIGLPHLLFTEEGKKEITASIKAAIANIDLSAEGTAAMRSFASGFAGLDMILNPFIQGVVASAHESFNEFITGLPDIPGISQYKQYIKDAEADAEELKRKYGLTKPATKTAFGITPADSTIKPDGLVLTLPGASGGAPGQSAAEMLAKERNLRLEDAQKMIDSSDTLKQKYEAQASAQESSAQAITAGTEAVEGFTQAVSEATTAKTKTAAEAAVDATTAKIAAESRGGGDSYDLFSGDPAAYLEKELKADLDLFYGGSLDALIKDYESYGKTLQDKIHSIFAEGKSLSGYGGDESEWMAKASPALSSFKASLSDFSSIIGDGNVTLSEAARYLNQYNQESGQQIQYSQQQIGQSHEMLSAIMQISAAQSTYSQYMSDGSLSTQEAADMNSRLAEINRLLGDAGVTATGGVSGLPPALQSLASYASSAVSQINAAISSASAAVASAQQYLTSVQTVSQYKPDTNYKSSMANKYNITVTGNTFGSTTTAGKVVSDILNSSRASGF